MKLSFALIACFSLLPVSGAVHWPQFRGPNGSGVADSERPPTRFGTGTNLIYKIDLAPGASSPAIWDDRIFLSSFSDSTLKAFCLDRKSGLELWSRKIPADGIEKVMPGEGTPASETAATDGKRVVYYFGSSGLFCFDFNGEELWSRRMPVAEQIGDFGSGTSPIIYNQRVYLNRDMARGSFLLCADAATGKEIWKKDRPSYSSSWSTPVIWNRHDSTEVVVAGFLRIKGYDAQTGRDDWELPGLPGAVCTSPVIGDGMVYFAGWSPGGGQINGRGASFESLATKYDRNSDGALERDELDGLMKIVFAIWDIDGDGKIMQKEYDERQKSVSGAENSLMCVAPDEEHSASPLWKETPKGLPYVPSPLFYRGKVYLLKDGGLLSCFEAKSGQPFYEQERIGALGNYYASPVAADGRVYTASLNGVVAVIRAGEKFEVIARNDLGERIATTPALCDNKIYVRSARHFRAFGTN
jgi:outer membrane protein assembly factor BamB